MMNFSDRKMNKQKESMRASEKNEINGSSARHYKPKQKKKRQQKIELNDHLLIFPLGIYTFPDGVLTKQEGSKSTPNSVGFPVTRPFIRFIVGLRGGTSGGAEGKAPSRRQPVKCRNREKKKNMRNMFGRNNNKKSFTLCVHRQSLVHNTNKSISKINISHVICSSLMHSNSEDVSVFFSALSVIFVVVVVRFRLRRFSSFAQ